MATECKSVSVPLEGLGGREQEHFTLRRQTGIDSRGGENRTGSGRLVSFMGRTGRCQGAAQRVLPTSDWCSASVKTRPASAT